MINFPEVPLEVSSLDQLFYQELQTSAPICFVPMVPMIITSQGFVSMSGICLDGRRPFDIWEVTNEGQQPFVRDVQGSELRGLSFLMRLVSRSLSISFLTFVGWLLSCRFFFLNRLVCDHDRLGYCSDIVLQC